ncbi:zinc finger BED domain-containing protein RICESLEEPER 2-like protein [Tanacetum coccineum]|uniref:Zinc finger BED domain-containing protein RICESLEEPER 2-like protein n=1 Tax=Tanacetum coccineum TaxID=301880 RepID=A0ABQ5J388_9ASTR
MSREKMAITIIKHNYPFSYVENEATRHLQKFLHRDAIPICKNSARAHLLNFIVQAGLKVIEGSIEKVQEMVNDYCKVLCFAVIMDPRYKDGIIDYNLFKLEMADEVRQQKVDAKIDSLYELYGDYEFNIEQCNDSFRS